jgi:hypothetical protein
MEHEGTLYYSHKPAIGCFLSQINPLHAIVTIIKTHSSKASYIPIYM